MNTIIAHPTRDEWESRQRSGPPELLTILAAIQADEAAADAEEARRLAEADAATVRHRAAFELTVRAALESDGGLWLAAFRSPDYSEFRGATVSFAAHFDPRAVGLWPLALVLYHTAESRGWFPDPKDCWAVYLPTGPVRRANLKLAVAVAKQHTTTPF